MLTFNQVITALQQLAESHYQIQSFGFGNIWDIEEKDKLSNTHYPMMFATTNPGKGGKGVLEVNLKLLFFDLVKSDQSDINEVLSDQFSIMQDVLAQLKSPVYDFSVADTFSFDDFAEKFTRDVAGWEVNVVLRLPWAADRCQVPTTVITTGSGSCPVVTIYQADGTTVETTIPAGGSYTLEASGPATVTNSDGTYSEEVEPEATLTLADTTYIINVNGVEDQRFDEPSMIDLEINIS